MTKTATTVINSAANDWVLHYTRKNGYRTIKQLVDAYNNQHGHGKMTPRMADSIITNLVAEEKLILNTNGTFCSTTCEIVVTKEQMFRTIYSHIKDNTKVDASWSTRDKGNQTMNNCKITAIGSNIRFTSGKKSEECEPARVNTLKVVNTTIVLKGLHKTK